MNRNLDRTIPAAMILEARVAVSWTLPGTALTGAQTLLYPDDRLTLAAEARCRWSSCPTYTRTARTGPRGDHRPQGL